jgi:hypothetical protein
MTPPKSRKMSKRGWDAAMRNWRRALHVYDPEGADKEISIDLSEPGYPEPEEEGNEEAETSFIISSSWADVEDEEEGTTTTTEITLTTN